MLQSPSIRPSPSMVSSSVLFSFLSRSVHCYFSPSSLSRWLGRAASSFSTRPGADVSRIFDHGEKLGCTDYGPEEQEPLPNIHCCCYSDDEEKQLIPSSYTNNDEGSFNRNNCRFCSWPLPSPLLASSSTQQGLPLAWKYFVNGPHSGSVSERLNLIE